jgi:hypothetical protein
VEVGVRRVERLQLIVREAEAPLESRRQRHQRRAPLFVRPLQETGADGRHSHGAVFGERALVRIQLRRHVEHGGVAAVVAGGLDRVDGLAGVHALEELALAGFRGALVDCARALEVTDGAEALGGVLVVVRLEGRQGVLPRLLLVLVHPELAALGIDAEEVRDGVGGLKVHGQMLHCRGGGDDPVWPFV